jgi:hypothetical protein
MADSHQAAFLKRRLTSKQVNLKDSKHDQRCFARLMFPDWLPQFRDPTDRTGVFTPAVVYRSYLAAVWEELWAFDKDRHMMQDVEDLADVVDIVRKNFTSSRADLIQKITAYAVGRRRAVQGEKVSNTQLLDHLIQSVELVLHSTSGQCRTSTDKAEGSCFT